LKNRDVWSKISTWMLLIQAAGSKITLIAPIDEVVFAEAGDLALLGARTLEGLNLTVDSARKKLVAAGPLPAA